MDVKLLVRTFASQGKNEREIADFLGVNFLKVRAILDADYIKAKKEAAQAANFKKALLRKEVQYAPVPLKERGTYMTTQEGKEALERIKRPYKAVTPEFARDMISGCKLLGSV